MKRLLRRRRRLALAGLLLVTACRSDGKELEEPRFPLPDPPESTIDTAPIDTAAIDGAEATAPSALQLFAPWPDGGDIPVQNTCDGGGTAPALTWSNLPPAAVEVALTVTDLDDDLRTLWIVDGISASEPGIAAGAVPVGAIVRPNSSGDRAWEAPCPPAGEEHLYLFTIHALNQQLELADTAPANEVIALLNSVAIDQISISGDVVREG